MKKASFDVSSLIIIIIVLLVLSPLAAFLDYTYKQREANSNLFVIAGNFLSQNTPIWIQKSLGYGFVAGWWDSFFRGIFAMAILWIIYRVIQLFRILRGDSPTRKDYEELHESQTQWFRVIGGDLWKIPVVAIFFATFMQVPILNRILYFILFDFAFDYGSFAKVLTLTFVLGFFPALIENFFKETFRIKLQKRVWDAEKAGAINKAQSKIISEGIKKD